MTRKLYRHADLRRLIEPSSIAIVGASPREGSFGARVLHNLRRYRGEMYLVNGRYDRVEERQCYATLSALPRVPDCVVVVTAREQVEKVVVECGQLGVGGVILFAAGFSETGQAERVAEQERIAQIARRYGVHVVGPNCIGIINNRARAHISFSPASLIDEPRPASIGLVSQSGALGLSLSQAIEHGASFSHVLTSGNSCDVDMADYVAYLAEDQSCKAIACVFEGMADPMRLIEAAGIARQHGKPVVVFKIANGELGAAAAMSHTGSLAGSQAAYRAAFERAGIVVVDKFEALVEIAAFFAKAPRPMALGVAVASSSGGAVIMAADEAELHSVDLPQPGPDTCAVLAAAIPDFVSAKNPCDITAQIINDPASFIKVSEALLADPAYGALVAPFPYAYDVAKTRIRTLDELTKSSGKIACIVWLAQWMEGPGSFEAEQAECVALFRSMSSCFYALSKWHWWARQFETPTAPPVELVSSDTEKSIGEMLDGTQGVLITEARAKQIMSAYGLPMVVDRLVLSVQAAVDAAREFGFPVVMKAESENIPHKTEAGVVRLGLADENAVRSAYAEVMSNALRFTNAESIKGVLIQPMIEAGVEVIVGARIDPMFGPMVVVGLGGVMVEVMRDTVVALAPLNHEDALRMMHGLKGIRLLQGFRGSAPVDLDSLANIICRVGQFASDHRRRITELDLNPIICSGGRIVGVDALIGLKRTS